MWNRAFMRLLSLSFTAFFIAGLLWRESRPRDEAATKPSTPPRPDRDGTSAAQAHEGR
jgi:hypothetical protein